MRALSLGLTLAFGLGWLACVVAEALLPRLLADLPGLAGPAARTALDWASTQTASAMGLCAVAYFACVTGARGWGLLALIAILPLLALAVVQFDPRITAQGQAILGPAFNDLRAAQPLIRLGLFLGVAMVAAAHALTSRTVAHRAVGIAVLAGWAGIAAMVEPEAMALMALPAALLALLAALVLAEQDRPAAPYICIGLVAVFAGTVLILSGSSPRVDLRPAYVGLVLLAALAHRRPSALPQAVFWVHGAVLLAGLAYLAPGLQQLGDVRPALTFAEMGAVIARAEALRTGVSLLVGLWVLLGVLLVRRRPALPPPAPVPAPTQG